VSATRRLCLEICLAAGASTYQLAQQIMKQSSRAVLIVDLPLAFDSGKLELMAVPTCSYETPPALRAAACCCAGGHYMS
jgi:hypothetical protein